MFTLTPDGKTIAGYYSPSQYSTDAGSVPEAIIEELRLPKYKRTSSYSTRALGTESSLQETGHWGIAPYGCFAISLRSKQDDWFDSGGEGCKR